MHGDAGPPVQEISVEARKHHNLCPESREELLSRSVKPFRGGLVLKAHGLMHHSTLGWRVIQKERSKATQAGGVAQGQVTLFADA